MKTTLLVQYLSGLAFIMYGVGCLVSQRMKAEFVRFGLRRFRVLVGLLECLGGAGLLVGFWSDVILLFSSAGLSLLMLLGVVVRVYLRDTFLQTLPALVLLVLNMWIFISVLQDR